MVILMAHGGGSNPYIKLLATSLEAVGLKVRVSDTRYLILWFSVLKYGWPNVIHLQWPHSYFTSNNLFKALRKTVLFYIQWFILRLLGVRFVWTVHELVNFEKHQAAWELFACRLLARVVDDIIVHCRAVVPDVAAAYRVDPERLRVVAHGHYADWYPPAISKEEARHMLGLPTDVLVFLFYGGIRTYKGLDRLLDTFATLDAENVCLILAGKLRPASLGQPLLARAAVDPRVMTYFEYIPDDRLVTYISACDLVVLPYRETLTSGAVILAGSYGRPVLIPKLGCMAEFPSSAAILYDPETPDGLRKALEQALSAPLVDMGSAAKSYIEQFPWSLVASEILAIYLSSLGISGDVDIVQLSETH